MTDSLSVKTNLRPKSELVTGYFLNGRGRVRKHRTHPDNGQGVAGSGRPEIPAECRHAFRRFRGGGRCSRAPGGCRNRRGSFPTHPCPDRTIALASLAGFGLLTPALVQASRRIIGPGGRSMLGCGLRPEPPGHGFDLIRVRLGKPATPAGSNRFPLRGN